MKFLFRVADYITKQVEVEPIAMSKNKRPQNLCEKMLLQGVDFLGASQLMMVGSSLGRPQANG